MKSNFTIKISSSFNVGYIFDTKNFYGSLCALSSSIFLQITHASISFFSVICFILIRTLFIIFRISGPSNGSNLYQLVVLTHIVLLLHLNDKYKRKQHM